MPTSLDSARPILAPSARNSVRYSTYSMDAPSFAPTVRSTDSATAEIHTIEQGLDRMENKALQQQRVTLNEDKVAFLQKLALGAKLDRALDRRMTGQDAVMRAPPTKTGAARRVNNNSNAISEDDEEEEDSFDEKKKM